MAITDFAGRYIPDNILPSGDVIMNWVTLGAIGIILALIIAVITFFVIMNIIYNKKIVVFRNISGKGFTPVFRDKARIVRLGSSGEEILYLQKSKVYRVGKRPMEKNVFWYAVLDDQLWYNFTLGDLDKKMNELGVKVSDLDMRYQHVAIRRNLQDRLQKPGWWAQYGTMVISLAFMAVIFIFMFLLYGKFNDTVSAAKGAVEAAAKVVEGTERVLSAQHNIQSGDSGRFVSALWYPLLPH